MPDPALDPQIEVRRSARRRRTVSAYREGARTIVLVPARLSRAQTEHWVRVMVAQLAEREARSRPSDAALLSRARELSTAYLDGRAQPASVRWVTNQRSRWGSCTPADRSIRLSHRLQGLPPWVVDYVLLHELAHLLEPGHGPRFWRLLAGFDKLERARGFLDGVAAAAGLPWVDDADSAAGAGAADDVDSDDATAGVAAVQPGGPLTQRRRGAVPMPGQPMLPGVVEEAG